MKVLVTGGAGFIGTNFIVYLTRNRPHWKIVNVDNLTYAGLGRKILNFSHGGTVGFYRADIVDKRAMDSIFRREMFDAVVNFAAESHVDRSIQDATPFIRSNIIGTENLLEQAKNYGVKKIIQVSTDEVYGSLGKAGSFTEDSYLRPNNPYSASKAAADLLCRAHFMTHETPVIVTRCSNNYGPYQHPEKFVPLCITNALENCPIPVYGDGENVRDWIYVEDHCRALMFVLEKGKTGEIYNIGGGNEVSNIDLARKILKLLGKDESLIKFVRDRPGHDRRYSVCYSKIMRDLGWKPRMNFNNGLETTVKWYVENSRWWKYLKGRIRWRAGKLTPYRKSI